MNIQYYQPITRVIVPNIHVLPLLLQVRCFGQSVCSSLHLEVNHAHRSHDLESRICKSCFHKALLVDVDDSPRSSYRKGTLRLEGRFNGQVGEIKSKESEIFAILELNLGVLENRERNLYPEITLSPVPFGLDLRPKLPYGKGEELAKFLQVAREVLLSGSLEVNGTLFHHTMFDFLEWLGVVTFSRTDEKQEPWYKVNMVPQQFENIFGVKLP